MSVTRPNVAQGAITIINAMKYIMREFNIVMQEA